MNFDFLKRSDGYYDLFAEACIEAERVYSVSPVMCAVGCRRALELAVKWVYAADDTVKEPYRDNLASRIDEQTFKDCVDERVWRKLRQVNRLGNKAVHTERRVKPQEAILSLRTLFDFVEWIDYCYGPDYEERYFDEARLPQSVEPASTAAVANARRRGALVEQSDADMARHQKFIREQSGRLTGAKAGNVAVRSFNPDEVSEYETRKLYIDDDLRFAGWKFDGDVVEEREVRDAPAAGDGSNRGRADYLLLGKDGKPLAVVEAKRTMISPLRGLEQARFYAHCLQREYGYKPLIFLSNGFETFFCDDDEGPYRKVSGFFSRSELQTILNRHGRTGSLSDARVNDEIAGRYYQIRAIRKVCANIEAGNRKSLLVMATGTGKTRVAIGLVDVLMRANHVKNVLFLADRVALVAQAKQEFQRHLPNTSLCDLCKNKRDADARIVFSTYKTILNSIDGVRMDDGTRLYTPAHFDLIIVDEAHRSIFNRYRDIFAYFDALFVGLTATPANEVDRNTYDFFEVERGVPTDVYTYEEAIGPDDVLVPYVGIETHTSFLDNGITYDELPDDEKETIEEAFAEEGEEVPEVIPESALGKWLFNDDTVDSVLDTLMDKGIHVNGGETLGKTIIFAASRKHADFIVERFNKRYARLAARGFIKCVVHGDSRSDAVIDEFKLDEYPVITVSVDKMDTGIDVPEVVNLVFFKKVRSRIKFWQMIGRGTRKCPDLDVVDSLAGESPDKTRFFVLDWCRNFEFFNEGGNAVEAGMATSQSARVFSHQAQLAWEFQASTFSSDEWQEWRGDLVDEMHGRVVALDEDLISVRLRRPVVHRFKQKAAFDYIDDAGLSDLQSEIAPLVSSDEEDTYALRFDAFMYGFMCALCSGIRAGDYRRQLTEMTMGLQEMVSIPQVREKLPILRWVSSDRFFEEISILDLEEARKELRGIIRFLENGAGKRRIIYTSLADPVTGIVHDVTLPAEEVFESYELKVTRFLQDYQDNQVIKKLHENQPLTSADYDELERIFTEELGSREDYDQTFGETPFGLLVRQIVRLDHNAVMEAFAGFLNDESLTDQQIVFVETVIGFIEKSGYMELSVLGEAPFDRPQPFVCLFDDAKRKALVEVIESIKRNAERPAA